MHGPPDDDWSITRSEGGRSTNHLDGVLAGLAHAQGGAVARWQLVANGIGEDVIDWRLGTGHLPHLTLAGRRLTGVFEGLPVTVWPLTVLDLAALDTSKRLALALDRTVTLGLFDVHAIEGVLARHPRAHGTPALKRAVAVMTDEGDRTRSPAEADVRWLVLQSDLPRPLVNHSVRGYVVDLYWPSHRLIVEVDSSRWHDGPFARRGGHHRQAVLEAGGHAVLRVRCSDPGRQILQRIRAALAARTAALTPPPAARPARGRGWRCGGSRGPRGAARGATSRS